MDSVFNLFATLSLKADEFNKGLDNAKQKMEGFGSQMKTATDGIKGKIEAVAPKFQEVGQKFQEVGTKVTSVGKTIAPVSAAFTAVGIAGVKSFAEVDKTMALTNKTMGNTPQQAKLIGDAMKQAAANSTFGMNDAATATLNFARAGLNAEQAAATLAPAMNLAAGEGGNLDVVSAGLVGTINGFGDSFDNAEKYADVFANACNNSALDVDGLSDSMSVAAPIFSTLGYSINDAALYMGTMANNGIDASVSANSLKTGMARLVDPAKAGAEWMKKLGIEVTNSDGTMKDSVTVQKELHDAFSTLSESEQAAAASAIFGKNQMAPWLALINTAPEDVSKLSDSLEKEGTTAEMAEAMMSGFGGSLEKLKSSADVAATSIGEALAPTISALADGIQKAVDWFNGLSESQQQVIATIGLLVAAAAPLLIIGGQIMSGLGLIITNVPIILGGLSTFGGFITATLIPALGTAAAAVGTFIVTFLPFIAIAAAVVAAGVLIYKNWDTIKEKAKQFVDTVVKKFNELKEKVVKAVTGLLEPVIQKFQAIFDAIKQKWEAFMAVFKPLLDAFANLFSTIFQAIIILVGRAMDSLKSNILQIWDKIKTAVGEKVEAVKSAIKEKFDTIVQIVAPVMEKVLTAIITAWNKIQQKVGEVIEKIKTTIRTKFTEMVQVVASPLQSLFNTIKNKFDSIKQSILGVVNKAKTWGRDLIKNFIAGIKEKINDLTKTINGVAKTIKNKVGFSEPKEGPLSDFHTYAPDMIDLFIQGIRDNSSKLNDAVNNAFDFSQPTMPETGAQLAFAGAGGQYTGNGQNIDTGAFSEAVVNALDDLTVIVNIGQERLEGVVNQVIQKRNYKSGGR